ncbi:hypothetical protein ACOSP7_014752 [Xanthoceras sorbifolium]
MSLLGKLIAYKEVNREAFRATITSIWRTTKEVEVESIAVDSNRVSETQFRYALFWIQLHNLPLTCLNKEVGLFLGGLIGEVKEIDTSDYEDCLGKFIRVKVLIDVEIPLK